MEVMRENKLIPGGNTYQSVIMILLSDGESEKVMQELHTMRAELPEGSILAELLDHLARQFKLDPTLVRKTIKGGRNWGKSLARAGQMARGLDPSRLPKPKWIRDEYQMRAEGKKVDR